MMSDTLYLRVLRRLFLLSSLGLDFSIRVESRRLLYISMYFLYHFMLLRIHVLYQGTIQ
jgi:hypothetical protein